MSVSSTKDLLSQLADIEKSFSKFSFEELGIDEAKALQNTFNKFRDGLENRIYSPSAVDKSTNDKTKRLNKNIDKQNKIISHVSHEMRTPLNGIIGFANLLQEEDLNSSQQQKVKAIQMASNSLLKIINELLEYAKVSSDGHIFQKIDFSVENFINDVMFLCETLIVNRDVELILNIDKNVPKVINGDPSKLSQVLLNLLGNAIKFVEKGSIVLSISVLEKTKDNCLLQFEIKDTGVGIPADKMDTIFDDFTQGKTETNQKYGGTGLGLSITKQLIEKKNGKIKLTSVEGEGTTVTFTIPFGIGSSKNLLKKKGNSINVQKGKELLNGTNILVFEDNLMNQHLIQEQLNKWDCNVYNAIDFKKGLAIISSKNIDLVLMDLKMPELNGLEISKLIRNHKNKCISKVPIIAFSADFSEQDKEECLKLNIQDFLLKPYTLDELLLKIVKNKRDSSIKNPFTHILQKEMIVAKENCTVNLDAVLNDCFNDLDMLMELIKLFKDNNLEFIGNVKLSLAQKDLSSVALSAHKLKAGMAMLKADGMRNLVIEIESNSKQNNLSEVLRLYDIFLRDYPFLEKNLDKDLERLKSKR